MFVRVCDLNFIIKFKFFRKRFERCAARAKRITKLTEGGQNKSMKSSFSVCPDLSQDYNCTAKIGRRYKRSLEQETEHRFAPMHKNSSSKSRNSMTLPKCSITGNKLKNPLQNNSAPSTISILKVRPKLNTLITSTKCTKIVIQSLKGCTQINL